MQSSLWLTEHYLLHLPVAYLLLPVSQHKDLQALKGLQVRIRAPGLAEAGDFHHRLGLNKVRK